MGPLSKLRAQATYANVTATLALFVALGGGSFAVALSGSEKKVVKKIAVKQADKRISASAADLSVEHAKSADSATTAGQADVASSLAPSEGFRLVGTAGQPGFNDPCWVNYDAGFNTVAFYKDATGIVHLRGLVKNGCPFGVALPGGIDPIFTLPAGYRPAAQELFVTERSDGSGRLDVEADGDIVPIGGILPSGGWISLGGLSFRAAG
jgi:hypothetical protein